MALLITVGWTAVPAAADQWLVETTDPSTNVGYYSAIASDSHGFMHISYYDAYNDALKYARWTGNEWQIRTVDSDPPWGDVGWYTSIAVDSSDCAHISYYKSSGGALRYAHWDGSNWHITDVETGHEKIYTSIALDSSGYLL
jgi:hypothetical protein